MEEEHSKHVSDAVEAARIAREVAQKAAEVAENVVKKATETAEKVLLFAQTVSYIQSDISEIKIKLDNKFVTKDEFALVKGLVFGFSGLALVAVVGAIIGSVIIK